MKTQCPLGYHYASGYMMYDYISTALYVCTHAPGHMMYGYICTVLYVYIKPVHYICPLVHELPQSLCGDNREGTLFL